jgi:hypothetical protein
VRPRPSPLPNAPRTHHRAYSNVRAIRHAVSHRAPRDGWQARRVKVRQVRAFTSFAIAFSSPHAFAFVLHPETKTSATASRVAGGRGRQTNAHLLCMAGHDALVHVCPSRPQFHARALNPGPKPERAGRFSASPKATFRGFVGLLADKCSHLSFCTFFVKAYRHGFVVPDRILSRDQSGLRTCAHRPTKAYPSVSPILFST